VCVCVPQTYFGVKNTSIAKMITGHAQQYKEAFDLSWAQRFAPKAKKLKSYAPSVCTAFFVSLV